MVATEAVSIKPTKTLQDDTLGKLGWMCSLLLVWRTKFARDWRKALRRETPWRSAPWLSSFSYMTTASVTLYKRISRTGTGRAVL